MSTTDPNVALLPSHSSRVESPEPLSPTATSETPRLNRTPPRSGRPSRRDYHYSTIETRSISPSPSRPAASPVRDPASLLAVPRLSDNANGSSRDDGTESAEPDATPEDPADALSRPLVKAPKPVDIVVYTFVKDVCVGREKHLKNVDDLRTLLEDTSSQQGSPNDFLLLIEDISNEVVESLVDILDLNPKTVAEHVKGRVNDDGLEKRRSDLHVDRIQSTFFDHISRRDNQESLTWWKLFSHSRAGYTREKEALDGSTADTRKMTVPHFEVHVSDTFRRSTAPAEMDLRVKSVGALVRTQWKRKQREMASRRGKEQKLPSSSKEDDTSSTAQKSHVELRSRKVHRLDAKTYRPHQVVTEVKEDTWGAAAEERITFSKLERDGSKYCQCCCSLCPLVLSLHTMF